jgi:16S rRNA (guanine966-N2)-methyltransferase
MREEEVQKGRRTTLSRIIAGRSGGRRITMPSGRHTRPTTDRVREAIFSAVASWAGTADRPPEEALTGLAFCDLYAGSGAVGLEAASRGADPVLLIEHDRATSALIRRNAAELGLPVAVRLGDVPSLLRRSADSGFDIVFADPPYELSTPAVEAQLADLETQGWLNRSALVMVERSRRTPAPTWPAAMTVTWSRAYGETTVYFGVRSEEEVAA